MTKKSFSKTWQYYIWLVVILRLLVPYSPEASLVGNLFGSIEAVAAEQAISFAATAADTEIKGNTVEQFPAAKTDGQTVSEQWKEKNYSYIDYCWFIWIQGVFILFTIRLFQYRWFIHYIRAGSRTVKDGELLDLFLQVENELAVKKRIPLYQSNMVKSPMLIGLLKPVIIIPENALAIENLKYVFKHELIHYKRFDIWYKWLVQLTVCIHWFNPVIHIMSRRINSLCEFSCDEAVSRGLDATEKMKYCSTILSAISFNNANKGNSISLALCEEKKNLKERLGAIMSGKKVTGGIFVLSAVLILVLCCTAVFLGAFSADSYGRKPVPEAGVVDNHEEIKKTVIIDPGHGGADTGSAYNDVNYFEFSEKDRNLKISLLLRDMLEKSGVNVVLTRQVDQQLSLEARMESANALNASLFVSIHFDASADNTKQGTLTLYNSSNDNSVYGITGQKAAQLIHNEIVNELETEDAGLTAMTESRKYDNLKMPAAIIELAFVSNASDRERLMMEGFDSEAAKALHDGILSALNEM